MAAAPPVAARHELDPHAVDLDALSAWLVGAIVQAVRVTEDQLSLLCDAVVSIVGDLIGGSGRPDRVAVEVGCDQSCLALRISGLEAGRPARSELLLFSV